MATDPGAVALLILGFYVLVTWCEELGSDLCRQRGFSTNLSCSSCRELRQFHLETLIDTCNGCCQQDTDATQTKQVQAFVKSELPSKYPGLEVVYTRGADPMIQLLNENHDVIETLSIDKWNTDSVEEFFDERLQK